MNCYCGNTVIVSPACPKVCEQLKAADDSDKTVLEKQYMVDTRFLHTFSEQNLGVCFQTCATLHKYNGNITTTCKTSSIIYETLKNSTHLIS